MGFAADGPKGSPAGSSESLYLGSPKGKLGKLNLQQWQVAPMGPLAIQPGWPELTGTAMGELWGFFPQAQPMKIARIAKDSGQVDQVKSLDSLGLSPVKNWAFAHGGGKMLVFYQGEKDASTSVYAYDPGRRQLRPVSRQLGLSGGGGGRFYLRADDVVAGAEHTAASTLRRATAAPAPPRRPRADRPTVARA